MIEGRLGKNSETPRCSVFPLHAHRRIAAMGVTKKTCGISHSQRRAAALGMKKNLPVRKQGFARTHAGFLPRRPADAVHMKNIASKGKTAEYCQSGLLSFCIPYAALRRGHKENNKKQKHRAFTFCSLTKCECSRLKKDISFC